MGLVKRHGVPRAKQVGTNIVRLETQALEADICGMESEEGDDVSTGDAFRKQSLGEKIRANGGVRVGLV